MRNLILAVIIMVSAVFPAHAGTDTGRVTRIYVHGSDQVSFRIEGSCKQTYYWSFALTGEIGKAWYAQLLSAAVNKLPVRVQYVGTCNNTEDTTISYIYQDF
ncbi:hypothetical protein [Luteimonas panaciterrae]|uniref:hypothetical protein n=1 Tax=Luteimonas panaciterrae TaxID=363885 RepID=UPI001CF96DA0|nr:hypothetical protein [Luteimonas panaciterrae]